MSNGEMSVREAGRRGGEAVKAKYGREHYARIGQVGGAKVAERGPAFFSAIGQIGGSKVRDTHGAEFYREIGSKGGAAVRDKHGDDYYARIGRLGGSRGGNRSGGVPGRTIKISAEQRAEIVRRRRAGEVVRALAAEFGVSAAYVYALERRAA